MVEFIILILYGGMLWTREYQNKHEVHNEPLSKLFYLTKYGLVALNVLLIIFITKVRFLNS